MNINFDFIFQHLNLSPKEKINLEKYFNISNEYRNKYKGHGGIKEDYQKQVFNLENELLNVFEILISFFEYFKIIKIIDTNNYKYKETDYNGIIIKNDYCEKIKIETKKELYKNEFYIKIKDKFFQILNFINIDIDKDTIYIMSKLNNLNMDFLNYTNPKYGNKKITLDFYKMKYFNPYIYSLMKEKILIKNSSYIENYKKNIKKHYNLKCEIYNENKIYETNNTKLSNYFIIDFNFSFGEKGNVNYPTTNFFNNLQNKILKEDPQNEISEYREIKIIDNEICFLLKKEEDLKMNKKDFLELQEERATKFKNIVSNYIYFKYKYETEFKKNITFQKKSLFDIQNKIIEEKNIIDIINNDFIQFIKDLRKSN